MSVQSRKNNFMHKRKIGKTTLETSTIMIGGNVFGWTIDEQRSFDVLDAFMEAGITAIDTADAYSRWHPGNKGGESETIIGKWLKKTGRRKDLLIATKVGADLGNGTNLKAEHIVASAEKSLRRLQTDHIDLYQSHYDDPYTQPEETMKAYDNLVKAGKVRYVGASNLSRERIAASLTVSDEAGLVRYQSLQPLYNLYDRETFENEYRQFCIDEGISVLPYFGLASGFLTGKYRTEADLSQSVRGNAVKKYMDARGQRILAALDEVSRAANASPASIALAWLIAQPTVAAAISSATSPAQVIALAKAMELKLDSTQLALLDKASVPDSEKVPGAS